MDRRTFLKATSAAAAGTGLVAAAGPAASGAEKQLPAAPAVASGRSELTFACTWDPDMTALGSDAARLFRRLQEALGSRYHLLQCADAAAADLLLAAPDRDVESEPASAFFAGLPGSFGMDPGHMLAWLTAGGGQLLWDELGARRGVKPLLAGHTGSDPGLWASRHVSTEADFAGSRVSVAGLASLLVRQLGATVVAASSSELPELLASRQIILAECGNPLTALALGLPAAATRFYRDGLNCCGRAIALEVRLGAWERFDNAARAALEGVAAQEVVISLSEALAHRRIAEDAIAHSPGIAVANLPRRIRAWLDGSTGEWVENAAGISRETARIRDSYIAFRSLAAGKAIPGWLA
jgi:TRAP-type mannitol/chloroaromatic compound transport system substrate-binding protein